MAARNGHLEVLKWAVVNECPRDEETCADADLRGALETLNLAREFGFPWNEQT